MTILKKLTQKALIFLVLISAAPLLCLADEPEITKKFSGTVKAMVVRHSIIEEYENVSDQKVAKTNHSSFDMLSKAILGGEMGVKKNGWEALVKLEFGIAADSDIRAREKTITLKRGRYSMTYGTQYHWGVNVGKKYLNDEIGDILWVGETIAGRDDYLDIGFDFTKEFNTTFNLIIGEQIDKDSYDYGIDIDKDGKIDIKTSEAEYKETVLAAIVKSETEKFRIKASYVRVNTVVDDGLDCEACKDSKLDGGAYTSMAFGVGYDFTPWMALSFNADFIRKKDGGKYSHDPAINKARGNIASDVVNEQVMVFILDVDLDDDSGFSVAYNTRSEKLSDDEDSPTVEKRVLMAYHTQVANVGIHAQYYHQQIRDIDADPRNEKKYLDETESKLGVGMTYNF